MCFGCSDTTRRYIEYCFFIAVVFFAFMAQSSGFWMQWAAFASLVGFLIICDYMFLSETSFIYDPNPKSWATKSGQSSY